MTESTFAPSLARGVNLVVNVVDDDVVIVGTRLGSVYTTRVDAWLSIRDTSLANRDGFFRPPRGADLPIAEDFLELGVLKVCFDGGEHFFCGFVLVGGKKNSSIRVIHEELDAGCEGADCGFETATGDEHESVPLLVNFGGVYLEEGFEPGAHFFMRLCVQSREPVQLREEVG